MHATGRMLPGPWLHTHRARYSDVLLLASHTHMIVNCSEFGLRAVHGEHAEVADPAFTRAKFARSGHVVCQKDPALPTFVSLSGAHDFPDGMYDRNGGLKCTPWRFHSGETFYVVAFHSPVFKPAVEHVMQHTNLFFFAELDPGDPHYKDIGVPQLLEPNKHTVNACH